MGLRHTGMDTSRSGIRQWLQLFHYKVRYSTGIHCDIVYFTYTKHTELKWPLLLGLIHPNTLPHTDSYFRSLDLTGMISKRIGGILTDRNQLMMIKRSVLIHHSLSNT